MIKPYQINREFAYNSQECETPQVFDNLKTLPSKKNLVDIILGNKKVRNETLKKYSEKDLHKIYKEVCEDKTNRLKKLKIFYKSFILGHGTISEQSKQRAS